MILLILGSIVFPIIMILLQRKCLKFRIIFNILAVISALIFGNIASIAIHKIIKNDTVFMTNIHGLFLNPFFLFTGAYLGVYLLYIITLNALTDINK